MRGVWCILALASAAISSGCTIAQMREDNRSSEVRIGQKQQDLSGLRETHAELVDVSKQLQADLKLREMTAAELGKRLDLLLKLNATMSSASERDRELKETLDREGRALREWTREIDEDTTLDKRQKDAKLQTLKGKTRKYLDLLLIG